MANTAPIYTLTPNTFGGTVTAADAALGAGTSANDVLVYTAGASGGFISQVRWTPFSTSGSVAGAACTGVIYLNNGATPGTASNNVMLAQITLPATTVTLTATTAVPTYIMPLNFQVPASYRLYAGVTAITANGNWAVAVVAGSY